MEDKKPLPFYGIVAIFITLFITLISSITSDKVLYEKFDKNRDTLFRITNSAFLTKIEITSPLKKRINNYTLAIYKQNKKIFYIDSGKLQEVKSIEKEVSSVRSSSHSRSWGGGSSYSGGFSRGK